MIQPAEQTETSITTPEGPNVPSIRWNFGVLVVDVTFFSLGMAFMDMNAIVPLLLARLGATGPLIGALAALRFLAFSAPQIVVAWAMHGRPRQKPFLAFIAMVTRLPLLLLPIALWHAHQSRHAADVALITLFALLIIWGAGDGMGYIPWMEIVARVFTDRIRGRFFATTQVLSGAASILVAAFLVTNILNSHALPYPHNYAVLAAAAAVMYQISMAGVLMIREPKAPAALIGPRIPAREYFGRMPALIRGDVRFIRLTTIQLLVGFGAASSPFYVLYATQRFHLPDSWGGTYQLMQAASVVLLTPVWTLLSEKRGPAASVRALAFACLLGPIFALTIGQASPWAFGMVFIMLGGSLGWGMWIVFNHYLLTHVVDTERPVMIALLNLLFLPSAIFPFLGGLMVQDNHFALIHGAPVLFVVTALVNAAGLALAMRLPPPADSDLAPLHGEDLVAAR